MTHARISTGAVALLGCALASAPVRAQDDGPSLRGLRLRVTAPSIAGQPIVGTLLEANERELVLATSASERTPVSRAAITRLERSLRPSRKLRGALIGFGVGLAAVLGKVAADGGCNDGCDASNVAAGALVTLSTAAVGAVVAPGERWTDAEPGLAVRLVPLVGRRAGLVLVARF